MAISIIQATLVSIVVQALFFGAFAVLFMFSQWILFGKEGTFNRPLWIASILMFFIAIAHIAIDAQRVVVSFLTLGSDTSAAAVFLNSLTNPSFLTKSVLYQVQTYLGDACIIYRVYVLYSRKWYAVIAPTLLLFVGIATGSGMIYAFTVSAPGASVFSVEPWAIPYVAASLFTNVICTIMIVTRIWKMGMRNARGDRTHMTPIIAIVESGAIYSASLFALVASAASRSNAYTIVLDLLCPIIGITFVMIIVRLHQERRGSSIVVSSMGDFPPRSVHVSHYGRPSEAEKRPGIDAHVDRMFDMTTSGSQPTSSREIDSGDYPMSLPTDSWSRNIDKQSGYV